MFSWTLLIIFLFASLVTAAQRSDSVSLPKIPLQIGIKDSLRQIPDSLARIHEVEATAQSLNAKIDSLNNLNLSPEQYNQKLYSIIMSVQQRLSNKMKSGGDSTRSKANTLAKYYERRLAGYRQRLDTLHSSRTNQNRYSLDSLGLKNQFKLPITKSPQSAVAMPALGNAQFQKNIPGLPATGISTPDIGTVTAPNVEQITKQGIEKSGIDDVIQNQKQVKEEAKKYQEKAKDIKGIDVKEELKNAPEAIEKQLESIDQVQDVNTELAKTSLPKGELDGMKPELDVATGKDLMRKRSKIFAGDHLAGKEQTVTNALNKMNKLQRKFDQVADIRKPPKKVPNALKTKPFIERIVPGLQVQVSAMDDRWKNLDISTNLNYLFHQNFRAGISGQFRIGLYPSKLEFRTGLRHYEWRIFGNVKLLKSFYGHLEGSTQTVRPPENLRNDRPSITWQETINVGIFKTYRMGKYVRGTTVVLYDLGSLDETLNIGQLSVRFGIELHFKKRKTQSDEPTIVK